MSKHDTTTTRRQFFKSVAVAAATCARVHEQVSIQEELYDHS
jgi:hypothetical protein